MNRRSVAATGVAAGDDAVAWARGVLADRGHDVLGIAEVHRRAWSTVWRVDTGDGAVFLKTAPVGLSAEPAVLDVLARHDVPHVQRPIAVADRHVLLPDGGPIVRDVPDRPERWRAVLRHYAALQRGSEPFADELVAAGVPDLRLDVLPDVATAVVDRWAPECATVLPLLRDRCQELDAVLPASAVEHSDLHDGNAFARGAVPFDWGDSCVSHPFCSLLVAGDEDVPGAVEGYLAEYTGLAASGTASDDAAVTRAVELARWLAIIPRALSWARAIDAAGDTMPEQWRDAARQWLLRLTEDDATGGGRLAANGGGS